MTGPMSPLDVPCEFCGARKGEPCRGTTRRNVDGSYRVWSPPANMGHLSRIRDSKRKFNEDKAATGPSVIAGLDAQRKEER